MEGGSGKYGEFRTSLGRVLEVELQLSFRIASQEKCLGGEREFDARLGEGFHDGQVEAFGEFQKIPIIGRANPVKNLEVQAVGIEIIEENARRVDVGFGVGVVNR